MAWAESLKSAQKTQLIQDGKRKIHFTFSPGVEMAEEYDMKTNVILVRKWKRKKGLMGEGQWAYEIGEDLSAPAGGTEMDGLRASASNPIFVRKDTLKAFVWRVRNLPYPLETYDVRVSDNGKNVIIRTTNKKYYKKFDIPDCDRLSLPLSQDSLSIAHANNTLLVTYQKPPEVRSMEEALQRELQKGKALQDGDIAPLECNPS